MSYTLQRTQIYLPRDLREEIDKLRALTGESMAEYMRKAARLRVKREMENKKEKQDLKKLAKEITSGVKKSGWDGVDVMRWQREIREDRDVNVHS